MALNEHMSDSPVEQPQKTEEAPGEGEKVSAAAATTADEPKEDGKSDSEAETEILSGKEDDRVDKSKKTIKLEEAESGNSTGAGAVKDQEVVQNSGKKHSLKRKRGSDHPVASDGNDDADSSRLSSTVSSPVIGRRTSDDAGSNNKSEESESSPPIENESRPRDNRNPKRANKNLDLESEKSRKGQVEHSNRDSALNARKRRDTRSGTDFDENAHRSTSPSSRSANRAQSIHSSTSAHQGGTTGKKRKKAPTPLHVERRSRPSEDVQESDSSSGGSQPRMKIRSEARENSMTWKPNKVSKTNKDRSGRTRLARACATGVAEEVEKWLEERQEDIDVADFAGNTPLQVASLEGHADIVKLLLEAGCATDSRNVDGDTPLIDAVENGHLDVVQLLLDAGVDPTQRSQNGKEPIELIKSDMDEAEEIRAALLASKKDKDGRRRQSEDHSRSKMSAPRDLEISSTANSGPSPTHSTRSPPLEPGSKRRTARSQHTDDNLLWVNPTPQRLRDAAGKGDIKIVNHILGMNPRADTDAILAAAQGGHDEVLGLMLAMGDPEPDPSPLRSGNLKPGYTTPMLAAIGSGSIKVLDLLVHQPGFDPTRRMHKNLTYYELAKERQGSGWEEEHDLLKDAYDQFRKSGGRRSNYTSPNKIRAKRPGSRKSSPEPSSSPHEVRKIRRPQLAVKEESDDQPNPAPKRRPSYQGTASRRPEEIRKLSSIPSDHEPSRNSKAKDPKLINRHRSTSPSQSLPKQRRRLLSGNEVKTDHDSKRNKTHTNDDKERRKSGDSANSHETGTRKSGETSTMSAPTAKKASSESPHRTKEELGRKRHRTSVSPQANRSETTDALKKKKRQRVDSQGNGIDKTLGLSRSSGEKVLEGIRERSARPGTAPAANMLSTQPTKSSPKASPTPTPAPVPTAPVAFMGSATGTVTTESPTEETPAEASPGKSTKPSTNDSNQTQSDEIGQSDKTAPVAENKESEREQEEERRQQREKLEAKKAAALKEAEERQKIEAELQAQLQKEQKEREDAERQAQLDREREEELERQAQEEQRRQREELEAQARKRREEELQRRRAEQERQRKFEQEKRRREAEQREIAARLKAQQEEEAARLRSLPNGLRRYFELPADQARSILEIRRWLPLRTVTTLDLDGHAEGLGASERWIANVQVAPLLANKDLELSQYTAWSRRPATSAQQQALWRQLRNPMAQAVSNEYISLTKAHNFEVEALPKFLNLKVFWIKMADFMDIVPRHPHLTGVQLMPQDFVLQPFPFGTPVPHHPGTDAASSLSSSGIKEEARSPSLTNGNGNLVNGHQ